jgi:hypothetical protein
MSDACAVCAAALEPRSGPGRPSVYCGAVCRRIAEFKIRALVRRIESQEIELREISVRDSTLDEYDLAQRRTRRRALRRWLEEDRAALRELLGDGVSAASATTAKGESS